MAILNYFAWVGTISLIYLAVQDVRRKGYVDDRKNWFMYGVTASILTHIRHTLLSILGIFIFTEISLYFIKKLKILGEADINTVRWIFWGFAYLNSFYLLVFFCFFALGTSIYRISQKALKVQKPVPYYPVLLASFAATCMLLGIYI